jgi:hypothetical protein
MDYSAADSDTDSRSDLRMDSAEHLDSDMDYSAAVDSGTGCFAEEFDMDYSAADCCTAVCMDSAQDFHIPEAGTEGTL